MRYVLAMDQGTTSSRAIVFDSVARIHAIAQQEYRQIYPKPGWVEHDPHDIWQSQLAVAQQALVKANITARDVAAIGITNQRETTLLWDRHTGKPIDNAIVWQDRRTADFCAQLKSQHEQLFRERTGLLLDPYFSGTKLAWLLDHYQDARKRAENGELAFGTVDTWLLWNLTRGKMHATDVTNASRTLLFDIHHNRWDDELLDVLDIPAQVLPQIFASSADYGYTAPDIFGAPILIGGVAGDQQAALFGQACHAPGMVKNTYGTGCFMLMQTGDRACESQHGLLTTSAAQLDTQPVFALEGSVFICGAVVQWLRDGLGIIKSAAEIEALAMSVPDSGGVYFVPAFTGLGSPHWDPRARGAIFGLTRGTTHAHIARAALEAIGYQSAELLLAMQKDAATPIKELRVDGGAAANNLLMQHQADLLGVPVVRPRIIETTALGAAYLAGLTADVWNGTKEIAEHWQIDRVFEPMISRDEAAQRMFDWSKVVRACNPWGMD
ncbi:glycerol kinase GlpK [Nitrosomonas sp. Is37]|uniref:glycerol kinase GlpK n=1 Tax=Nitrosomonas sp. Is37 TaxID=3080535 RepID=UPI00294AEFD5|nr:glycerol kinase GlpK [Nitrosomonas sp. Is37]MDV6345104.1 glycerol kinase GlpK [Nitrosomonas sp. Is37]